MEIRYWEPHVETADRKTIEKVQLKRLKYMIEYTYRRSPYYGRKFREAGLHPTDVKSLRDIGKFPFTTKDDVRGYGYPAGGDFLCVPREEVVCWHMSSGTTGTPIISGYTRHDYDTWMNLAARSYVTAGVKPGDVVMNLYGYGLFTGGLGLHESAFLVGATVIPWGTGRTQALIKSLVDFKVTVMTGTPSYQYYIASLVKDMNLDVEKELNLRVTMPGAEMWTEKMRQRIEEWLGLKAKGGGSRDIYGASELCGPGAGQECIYEKGFHFWIDHFLLEIVDPKTGEPVEAGEEGEMVFTHLVKEATPLVRYRLGDITVLDEEPCECGRMAFPRCLRVRARVDDVIHYKGIKILPSTIQEIILRHKEIIEYQVVVDKTKLPYEFIIRIEVPKSEESSLLIRRILNEFKNSLFIEPQIEVVEPGTLPRFEGKSRRVVVKEG
ncbi:MAG: phenylacetate--CoA ligase [Candidatus Nezhaarchaeota archaeon]|nr:phenylacetate--CoA ligase [Candidatus Nezhaarchaeota archaeon]